MDDAVAAARAANALLLLDSGNYEGFWKADRTWTRDRYKALLAKMNVPLAFSFDDQSPPPDPSLSSTQIIDEVRREQDVATATICPIVHGTAGTILPTVRAVAEQLLPPVLAVAERELGAGVLARAQTIRALRKTIDDVAQDTCLHILGTGNPISILIYAIVGAGSFDGLEWCQTCVNPDAASLVHFQQRELVTQMIPETADSLPYVEATLLHNLVYFEQWLQRIREALATGSELQLLSDALPPARRDETLARIASL